MRDKKFFFLLCALFLLPAMLTGCGGSGGTTITPVGGPTGTATLTWDAPTTRTDGSIINPATDILTYKLYYGTTSGMYVQSKYVANPGSNQITYTFSLSPGTYYFVVTAVDNYGQESGYSPEGSKAIS